MFSCSTSQRTCTLSASTIPPWKPGTERASNRMPMSISAISAALESSQTVARKCPSSVLQFHATPPPPHAVGNAPVVPSNAAPIPARPAILQAGYPRKNGDVLLHGQFQLQVVGHGATWTRAQLFGCAPFGGAKVQPFFCDQPGRDGGDFLFVTVHGLIVPPHCHARAWPDR